MRMFICPGCQGPNVSTQAEGNLHLLLNAESCALWLVCELWGLQVKNLLCRVSVLMTKIHLFPFRLYGDEALDNALNTFVTLLLSIPQVLIFRSDNLVMRFEPTLSPQTDLLDYPKLSQTYYVLLECLAQDHMAFLATLEPQVPRKVTRSSIQMIVSTKSAVSCWQLY